MTSGLDTPAALRAHAKTLSDAHHFKDAADVLWRAVKLRPDDAETLGDLGNALLSDRQPAQAVTIFRQALRLSPAEPHVLSNLGLALAALGYFEDAEVAFLEALHHDSVLASAHNNLGTLYIMMGRHQAALACLDYALALRADYPAAKRNRALAHLSLGNFEAGWRDYDHIAFGIEHPPAPAPAWNGQPLAGKTLLLTCEQGFGDTMQFIRYAPALRANCNRVIVQCPLPLVELLTVASGIDQVIPQGAAVPATDLSLPVAALPRVMQANLTNIPHHVPYLQASRERVAFWRERTATVFTANKYLVGIAWQGNPHHVWDQFRSLPLAQFENLSHVPGVQLLSLQTGPGTEQIPGFQQLTCGALFVPESHPHNLADTAALISLCDLVVSVDSAVAHLAGALAKPTWIPLSMAADWRWLTGREDSPWYPTVRLFRQKKVHGWEEIFDRMTSQLSRTILSRPPNSL